MESALPTAAERAAMCLRQARIAVEHKGERLGNTADAQARGLLYQGAAGIGRRAQPGGGSANVCRPGRHFIRLYTEPVKKVCILKKSMLKYILRIVHVGGIFDGYFNFGH